MDFGVKLSVFLSESICSGLEMQTKFLDVVVDSTLLKCFFNCFNYVSKVIGLVQLECFLKQFRLESVKTSDFFCFAVSSLINKVSVTKLLTATLYPEITNGQIMLDILAVITNSHTKLVELF